MERKQSFAIFKGFCMFFLFWCLMSGEMEPFFLLFGLLSSLLILFLSKKLKIMKYSSTIHFFGFISYVIQLLNSVLRSSIAMMSHIFNEKSSFETGSFKINVGFLKTEEKILFANIITMTPGTFVIAVNGDDFLIHSMDIKTMKSFDSKSISKLVKAVDR